MAAPRIALLTLLARCADAAGIPPAPCGTSYQPCLDSGDDEHALLHLSGSNTSAYHSSEESEHYRRICIQFQVSFPAEKQPSEGGPTQRVTRIVTRYSNVDLATLTAPYLLGDVSAKTQLDLEYSGYETPGTGGRPFGFDQFTIYHSIGDGTTPLTEEDSSYTVFGLYPNAAFVSVQVLYGPFGTGVSANGTGVTFTGGQLKATFLNGRRAPNPFVAGNPTVLTYKGQATCAGLFPNLVAAQPVAAHVEAGAEEAKPSAATSGLVSSRVRRPRCKETNAEVILGAVEFAQQAGLQTGPEGCSPNYLYGPGISSGWLFSKTDSSSIPLRNSVTYLYGFIKFKLPLVFNNFAERIFRGLKSPKNPLGYDELAFSASSSWLIEPAPVTVPFTVTALMLQAPGFRSVDGTAYVLFAPVWEVQKLLEPNQITPPAVYVHSLRRSVYILPAPDFAWYFRYREPSPFWRGNPGNAPCFETVVETFANPVSCEALGAYKPQITRLDQVDSVPDLVRAVEKHTR